MKQINIEIKEDSREIYVIVTGTIETDASYFFGDKIEQIHSLNPNKKIIIDFTKVRMITSACLRQLLKFKKENYDFELVGVNKEVYTVFKITGMDKILNLEQETISVNTEGCKLLGKGFHSEVYKLNNEIIAKIYYDLPDIDMLINERIIAQQAFIKGVPTEISFGMCESNGKAGLLYELVDADTLLSALVKDDTKMQELVLKYVELVKKMHEFDSEDIIAIPDAKQILSKDIDTLRDFLSNDACNKLQAVLDSIPNNNNLLHGDPHPANVMLTNKGMIFIDLSDMRVGNEIFDLVYLHRTFIQFNKLKDNTYALKPEQTIKLWKMFFDEYYKENSEEEKREIEDKISLLSLISITARFLRKDPNTDNAKLMFNELKQRIN